MNCADSANKIAISCCVWFESIRAYKCVSFEDKGKYNLILCVASLRGNKMKQVLTMAEDAQITAGNPEFTFYGDNARLHFLR